MKFLRRGLRGRSEAAAGRIGTIGTGDPGALVTGDSNGWIDKKMGSILQCEAPKIAKLV